MSIDYIQLGNNVSINYIVRGGDYTSIMNQNSFINSYYNGLKNINGLNAIVLGSNYSNFLCVSVVLQM